MKVRNMIEFHAEIVPKRTTHKYCTKGALCDAALSRIHVRGDGFGKVWIVQC